MILVISTWVLNFTPFQQLRGGKEPRIARELTNIEVARHIADLVSPSKFFVGVIKVLSMALHFLQVVIGISSKAKLHQQNSRSWTSYHVKLFIKLVVLSREGEEAYGISKEYLDFF